MPTCGATPGLTKILRFGSLAWWKMIHRSTRLQHAKMPPWPKEAAAHSRRCWWASQAEASKATPRALDLVIPHLRPHPLQPNMGRQIRPPMGVFFVEGEGSPLLASGSTLCNTTSNNNNTTNRHALPPGHVPQDPTNMTPNAMKHGLWTLNLLLYNSTPLLSQPHLVILAERASDSPDRKRWTLKLLFTLETYRDRERWERRSEIMRFPFYVTRNTNHSLKIKTTIVPGKK
jgi:hypothetical protein